MHNMPMAIMTVLGVFAPLFSKRVLASAKPWLVGAILAPGKGIVTAVLRALGKMQRCTSRTTAVRSTEPNGRRLTRAAGCWNCSWTSSYHMGLWYGH